MKDSTKFGCLATINLLIVLVDAAIPGVKDIAEKYCNDVPVLSIDAIVKAPNGPIYAFFENLFVKIDSITTNGLPVVSDESPSMIKKFWGKMPNYLDTGFSYDNKVYFFKDRTLWKHDSTNRVGARVNQIDPEEEFVFFKDKKFIYENILSVTTKPNPKDSYNDSQSIFVISSIGMYGNDRFIKILTFEGNTTKEVAEPSEILIDRSTLDLLYVESLVTDQWKYENQIVFKSLWFLNKIYLNLIHHQHSSSFNVQEFSTSVRLRTIGYNQVWLGCPQPMCLDSTIDTIVMLNDNNGSTTFIAFRGRFFWNITEYNPPFTSNAKLISDHWNGLPSYLDASYYDTDTNEIYFFKDELVYSKISNKWVPKPINTVFAGIPTPIDAAFVVDRRERLFFFKGDKYYIFETQANEVSITGKISEFPGLPNHIDSAIVLNDKVLVFKNWYYYQIDIQNFKGALARNSPLMTPEPAQSFQTLFHCPHSIYLNTEFETIDEYLKHYENYTKPIPANSDSRIPDRSNDDTRTNVTKSVTNSIAEASIQSIISIPPETSTTTSDGAKEIEVSSDNGSQSWIIYIILTAIMASIVFLIIVLTMFGNNKKIDKRNDEQKKTSDKKSDAEMYRKVNKPKKDQKEMSESVRSISLSKSTNKKPSIDTNEVFSITFDHDDEHNNNNDMKINSNASEEVNRQLVERVATEPFLMTKHPSLKPEEKPVHNNLFTRILKPKPESLTDSV